MVDVILLHHIRKYVGNNFSYVANPGPLQIYSGAIEKDYLTLITAFINRRILEYKFCIITNKVAKSSYIGSKNKQNCVKRNVC